MRHVVIENGNGERAASIIYRSIDNSDDNVFINENIGADVIYYNNYKYTIVSGNAFVTLPGGEPQKAKDARGVTKGCDFCNYNNSIGDLFFDGWQW